MNIFVVIPLYNEKNYIVKIVKDLSKHKLPLIVIDDGSSDGSVENLKKSGLKKFSLIRHNVNLGKGAAMKTGAELAFSKGADAVIFMDSDGQHKVSDLPKFIRALESGKYDVVFGSRNFSMGVPLVRFLGNKFASVLVALLFNICVSDLLCGFRAMTKSAYKKIKWESVGYGVETETVAMTGKNRLRYCEVPVETVYHNNVKGVTLLDAFGIFAQVLKWRFTI
jgi:glycosyltransferase involved in cell wall biosynthesis